MIEIYADGACQGNPGPGGWGAWLRDLDTGAEREIYGGDPSTTNNKMELTAAIKALQCLKRPNCNVTMYCDSQYVVKGANEWLSNWIGRGWRTASGDPVKNIELWQDIQYLITQHRITWVWVKGHAGNVGNERADDLADKGLACLNMP